MGFAERRAIQQITSDTRITQGHQSVQPEIKGCRLTIELRRYEIPLLKPQDIKRLEAIRGKARAHEGFPEPLGDERTAMQLKRQLTRETRTQHSKIVPIV